jgi:PKD repeat protein
VGNNIQLEQSSSNITDYLWNTGNINSNQIVDTSGTYILDVINDNGCENSDTIEITIIGDAPALSYSIPTEICQGSEFSYSESSTVPPGNNISDVTWDFGDLDSSFVSSGSHVYVDSGAFNASLEVFTLEGCKSKDEFIITVYPKPIVSFETVNYCPYEEIGFTPSNSYTVPLDSYNWDLGQGGATSTNSNPTHIYNTSGNYDVELIAIDTNNCSDTVTQSVYIQPAPMADILILNPCELSALEITDNNSISDTFSIVTYSWDYGDNTSAVNPVEDKFYELYGEYTVQLALTANNGCVDSIEQNITVHPNPIIDYAIGPACMGTWTTLTDLSVIPMGSLAETNWLINLQYTDNLTNTAFNFPTTGIQLVALQSTSDQGCAVDTTFTIDVADELKADFLVTPSALTTGTPILFSNQSIGMDSSFWDFGDGNGVLYNMNSLNEITYDGSLNGSSIDVSLVIVNNLGCRDTSAQSYELKEAFFDLAVQTIFVQDVNGFLTVGAEIQNLGSVPLENAELYLKTPENSPILENWTGFLAQNESEIYIFNAHPPSYISTQDETERFICVEGNGINSLGYVDVDFSNNTACKNIEGSGLVVLPIYPNPTEEDITLSILLTETSTVHIELIDQRGRVVLNPKHTEDLEAGIHTFRLPFSELNKGVYFVRVSDGKTTLLEKIVRY